MGGLEGDQGRPTSRWELYDLKADVGEERDVVADHPDVVKRVEEIAGEAHTPERKFGPAPKETAADFVK